MKMTAITLAEGMIWPDLSEGENPERGGGSAVNALCQEAEREGKKTGVIATDETASLYLADSVKAWEAGRMRRRSPTACTGF